MNTVSTNTSEIKYEKRKFIDYKEYLNSFHWNKIKTQFRKKYKHCAICFSKKALNVHHLTYKNFGNENPEDLILLCNVCHKKTHSYKSVEDAVKWLKEDHKIQNESVPNKINSKLNKANRLGNTSNS